MANITISGLTGKTAVATDEIEVQATAAGASNKVTLASAFAANNGATLAANTFTALQTITQASANAGILASTGYSLTGSDATGMVNLAGTWNTSGTPTAIKLNMTDTSSNAASLLVDLQVGGVSKFNVTKAGLVTAAGKLSVDGLSQLILNNGGGALGIGANTSAINLIVDTNNFGLSIRSGWHYGISSSSSTADAGTNDVKWSRGGAAIWQSGAANAASPVAQTLQAQGSRSGTDTNVGGANYTIQSGQGTGTGAASSLVFKTPVVVASGTGAQTMTTGLTVKGGAYVDTVYTVATLPTGIQGMRATVTDSNAASYTAGIGAIVAAGGSTVVPVWYDGTNWRIG